MKVVVTTPPASEPVTFADMQTHSKIDITDEQSYVEGLIVAARKHAEDQTRRALINQTITLYMDKFPTEINLPRPPVSSVTSIGYTDANGTGQTLSSALYQTDLKDEPCKIKPAYGQAWPSTRSSTYNAVNVVFVCGYGDAATDVPDGIRHAIKLLVAHWFENREPVSFGGVPSNIPAALDALLWQYRVAEIRE